MTDDQTDDQTDEMTHYPPDGVTDGRLTTILTLR